MAHACITCANRPHHQSLAWFGAGPDNWRALSGPSNQLWGPSGGIQNPNRKPLVETTDWTGSQDHGTAVSTGSSI